MATDYSVANARLAVPYLIECARSGRTITYGELAAKIGRHHRATPHLLEHVLRQCHKLHLPTIGTLVVNGTNGLPGVGVIADGAAAQLEYGGVEYRRQALEEQQRVFSCQDWTALLHEYGLRSRGESNMG